MGLCLGHYFNLKSASIDKNGEGEYEKENSNVNWAHLSSVGGIDNERCNFMESRR